MSSRRSPHRRRLVDVGTGEAESLRIVLISVSLIAASEIWGAGARGQEPQSRGALLFEHRCARCHGLTADGGEGLAPPLVGVFGSAIASRKDYLYTTGIKAKVGVWNSALLDHISPIRRLLLRAQTWMSIHPIPMNAPR